MMEYKDMSNSELKVKIVEMQNSYEALKSKIRLILSEMDELDKNYAQAKELYEKRTKGRL